MSFSSDAQTQSCVGFDCEIVPDGDEAVMNLTAPQGYQILPTVDGLRGKPLGARGLVRLDPCASHAVKVTLQDPAGAAVVKQTLFLPRFALPRTDVLVDGAAAALSVQCPRGMRVLAAVDGGSERTTEPSAMTAVTESTFSRIVP